MEKNTIRNHIYNNTYRNADRNMQSRTRDEKEVIDNLLRRNEQQLDCQGNPVYNNNYWESNDKKMNGNSNDRDYGNNNRRYDDSDNGYTENHNNGNCRHNCDNDTSRCDNDYNDYCNIQNHEHGCTDSVYVSNICRSSHHNHNFREVVWTGKHLQLTLMNVCRGDDVGAEVHNDTDQYIRVESGNAVAMVGNGYECMKNKYKLCTGDVIFIPAGTWHNIVNTGRGDLKLSSVYAPPHHKRYSVCENKNRMMH